MVRHAPIHRRSGHSDIAICCGRNVRGSSPSTSLVPLSNQVTTLNHKRFKGFKMFSDGHLDLSSSFRQQRLEGTAETKDLSDDECVYDETEESMPHLNPITEESPANLDPVTERLRAIMREKTGR